MGNELGAVIAADERRSWVEAGELLQHSHHVLGLADSPHADRQAQTAVLVDHVQEFQPPAIGGGVELEVHRPHLVRVCGLVTPHGAVGGTSPLLLSGSGPLQALLPPEPMHPLVVHRPALAPQHAVRHAPAPADVLGCDLPEPSPQLGLLDIDDFAAMPLGAAVLAHNPAGESLRYPEHGAQGLNSPAASFRAQKFPSASSYGFAGPAARASPSPTQLLPEAS
jgi:hypothetical protein